MTDVSELEEITDRAREHYLVGDVGAAIKLYDEAATGYEASSEPVLAATALISCAEAYKYTPDYKSPMNALRRAEKHLSGHHKIEVFASLLRVRATINARNKHLLSAYEDLMKGLFLVQQSLVDDSDVSQTLANESVAIGAALVSFFTASGEWKDANNSIEEATRIAQFATADVQYDLLVESGRFYLLQGSIDQVSSTVASLLQICQELGEQEDRPIAWLQYFALEAHRARLEGQNTRAATYSRDLFALLASLPDMVSDQLYLTVSADELRGYVHKLP